MEPRTNLSWSMGQRTLSVHLSITSRGVRILAVDTRVVPGGSGACSDLCNRIFLVTLVLRFTFARPGTGRADFPRYSKRFARLFRSPYELSFGPVQIAKRDSIASFTTTLGAPYRTPALRAHLLEI